MSKSIRAAIRIALVYAIFGVMWIAFSDRVLEFFVDDVKALSVLQTFKGWFFVIVTAGLLFLLSYRALSRTEQLYSLDPLTLLRRHYQFSADLNTQLVQLADEDMLMLVYLDINQFSELNRSKGHEFADQVLSEYAEKLRETYPADAIIGRLGADQFGLAIVENELTNSFDEHISVMSQQLIEVAMAHHIVLSGSVGIAVAPADGIQAKTLMAAASSALHTSKGQGLGAVSYYNYELSRQERDRQALIVDLRMAISEQQFSLVYQPQLDLKERSVSGVEVLIRWQHPTKGMISPAVFIPLAEEYGLAPSISRWVMLQAYEELSSAGILLQLGRISINISAAEFSKVQHVESLLQLFIGLPELAKRCQIEITETAALENLTQSRQFIERFNELGIRFSIDDFGTGYSSLAMLKDLPIDEIKIDKSFIDTLETHTNAKKIVQSILYMAQNFGIRSIAEGVERTEQLQFLKLHQCDEIQGYLFARPMPIAELTNQLDVLNALAESQ